MDRLMDIYIDGCINGWMDGYRYMMNGYINDVWMDGWIHKWCLDGWMDRCIDR